MNVHLRLHLEGLEPVLSRLDELKALLKQQSGTIMATLDDVKTQVAANTDAEQSAVLLLTQLHGLLVSAQANPTELQAVIDQLGASKDALAAAIVANAV